MSHRIKEALIEVGISQTELAKRLGKGFNMVDLYATNRVKPKAITIPIKGARKMKAAILRMILS